MRKSKRQNKKPVVKKKPVVEKLGIAVTLQAAAAQTGISSSILKKAKADGCTAFRANGNVVKAELIEYLANNPTADSGQPDYYDERAKDIRANRLLKEQKLREKDKLVWPVEKIRQAWTRNVIAAKTKFVNSESAVAAEASMRLNLTLEQISVLKEIHSRHNRVAMKELFAGDWGKTECPHCKKEIV